MAKRRLKTKGKVKKEKVAKPSRPIVSLVLAFAAGCIVCGSIFLISGSCQHAQKPEKLTLNQLLHLPEHELALCLTTRGHCQFDTGHAVEAQVMHAQAYKLMPIQVRLTHINQTLRSELKKINNQSKTKGRQ